MPLGDNFTELIKTSFNSNPFNKCHGRFKPCFFYKSLYHKFVCSENIVQIQTNLPKSYLICPQICITVWILSNIKYDYMKWKL